MQLHMETQTQTQTQTKAKTQTNDADGDDDADATKYEDADANPYEYQMNAQAILEDTYADSQRDQQQQLDQGNYAHEEDTSDKGATKTQDRNTKNATCRTKHGQHQMNEQCNANTESCRMKHEDA